MPTDRELSNGARRTINASAGESGLKGLRDLPALEVDRDSSDVRGWDVDAPGGEPLGVVTDMLVDPDRLTASAARLVTTSPLFLGPPPESLIRLL